MSIERNREKQERLQQLIQDVVRRDKELREKYQVGEKFRFIRESLQRLLVDLEQQLQRIQSEEKTTERVSMEDEVVVYVHLFNAQGNHIKNWTTMLTPKVFYEYSVNRPIYADKEQVMALIRSKPNKLQHAYLAIAIKKEYILVKDSLENAMIKVKEGSFDFNKLITLTHNDIDYSVTATGELIKK